MDTKYTAEQLCTILENYDHLTLHVHHTWKPDHADFTGHNHQALQDGMRRYHVDHNGWSDIGQHISLFPDGVLLSGRNLSRDPASIKGHNFKAFSMEMIGNFDTGHDELKDAQLGAAITIARFFYKKHGDAGIMFHREHSDKTCPGSGLSKEDFMALVKGDQMFSDVDPEAWYAPGIEKVVEAGLMGGYPDGTFRPKQAMTRAEFCAVIAKMID